MSSVANSKTATPFIAKKPDISGAKAPINQLNDKGISRCPPEIFMKKIELNQAKQQFRQESQKLAWIGERYGVQSMEYRAQHQVTQLAYDRMVKLQEEVDRLEKQQPQMPDFLRNRDSFQRSNAPKPMPLNTLS
jgi:hypothetical protein